MDEKLLDERLLLAKARIKEIPEELSGVTANDACDYLGFFISKSKYISYMLDVYENVSAYTDAANNKKMYEDILPENYAASFSNPDYAEEKMGVMGSVFSYISAELQGLPGLVFDDKKQQIVCLLELFLMIYYLFESGDEIKLTNIEETIQYYVSDYIEDVMRDRMEDCYIPERGVAFDIIKNGDLGNTDYLYKYGEYISDSEVRLAEYMNSLSDEKIESLAAVYTDGFRRGFDTMGIPFEGKNSVWIRYHIGQERLVRQAAKNFEDMGLKVIVCRCAINRSIRRQVVKQGYESTSPNKQFEYDHRNDDRIFLDGKFVNKRIEAAEAVSKELAEYMTGFAGPAVIETFGEELFSPVAKESVEGYNDKQQELVTKLYSKLGAISNKYLPGDSYSFTIIAFPMPDIGDDFEKIFDETIIINSLDNENYKKIQQSIIDVLDQADVVRVVGMNGNRTDMTVKMRELENPDKETQFENCTADVNIPLGEVFTSPVLKGTHGVLNVSSSYLNGYNFKDIELVFEDGVVKDYSCKNFDDEESGKRYIKENILFNHEFLPIGEFAIGTNTYAYTVAHKYNILDKLPILIVEKTGPHFAVGDTCYSHAEDHAVFNPDGKEIISRENDFSLLRDTEPEKAYFNCHTDITIPYNELGRLYAVGHDGTETDIIVEGKFVLPGTEELNKAYE